MELTGYGAITSVVVARAGEIVAEDYLIGDADSVRDTRSCTKTVLGMLLGQAIERGHVAGVDARVLDLLAGTQPATRADPAKQALTVGELLTMSSCLDCDDWDDSSPGNEELMYPQHDWLQFALDLPVRSGRSFSYCTAGVVLLGIALERALGEPLPTFAQRELFGPLGIDRAAWQQTPTGQTSTAGGLRLTSRSLLALGELYLNGGREIVPAAWVDESLRVHTRIDDETSYGYLWWLKSFAGARSFFMTGMGGNRVHVFPELEAVVVITSENFGRRDAHALSDRLLLEQVLSRWQ
ncbi:MAG TPA: serine hydrolase [Gaiellaceae bacterium]|jgi:CubicO group peptidase (beta-lactamase class C family)|nr:serine hydrolase [Gaiellaceae bacterium]